MATQATTHRGTAVRIQPRRWLVRLALRSLVVPVAAWAIDEAVSRTEAARGASTGTRALRVGAHWLHSQGNGPVARRLRSKDPLERPVAESTASSTTVTVLPSSTP